MDLQRLAVVALAAADLARDVDVGQELHLDLDDPVALAVLAAAALDVEREAARTVAAHARLGHAGEQLADGREQADVRGRVGARRPADGRLVDLDDLVDRLDALERVVLARILAGAVAAARASARYRISVTSVLLPDARHAGHGRQRRRAGTSTSMFLRLCARAPRTTSALPLPVRRSVGMGTARSPRR